MTTDKGRPEANAVEQTEGFEIAADSDQLFRVVHNICRNAVEARRYGTTAPPPPRPQLEEAPITDEQRAEIEEMRRRIRQRLALRESRAAGQPKPERRVNTVRRGSMIRKFLGEMEADW